jgi:hypothetical protein
MYVISLHLMLLFFIFYLSKFDVQRDLWSSQAYSPVKQPMQFSLNLCCLSVVRHVFYLICYLPWGTAGTYANCPIFF